MTGDRRFLIIAITAFVVAGCSANPVGSVAPTGAVASPTTTAWATSQPTTRPTVVSSEPPSEPTLTPGCSSLDDLDVAGIEVDLSSVYPNGDGGFGGFSVGIVHGALDVTRIAELSGQRRSVVPPPRGVTNGRGLVLGGRAFVTFPSTWFDGHQNPQAMIGARITLTLDDAAPIDLLTRIVPGNENFDQVEAKVPDLAGAGTVELSFIWADACFRYEATGTVPVDVVPLAETAGCELDEVRYWDQLDTVLDGSIRVGTLKPPAGSAFNEAKYAPYVNPGIDAFIGYMFDPHGPEQIVEAGSILRIEAAKPRVHLQKKLQAVTWTRRSLAAAVRDYPPKDVVRVFEGRLERVADGSFELRVPEEPGRYVVGLSVEFDSPCTNGTLWTVANIMVP